MAITRTNISIDEEVKEEASAVLKEMGLSLSGGIDLFLRAVVREKELPFPVTTKSIKKHTNTTLSVSHSKENELNCPGVN